MPYYDTIEEDLNRAKEILAKGKMPAEDVAAFPLVLQPRVLEQSGTIYGADTYAAYKLLESFVAEIERLTARLGTWDDCKAQSDAVDRANARVQELEREVARLTEERDAALLWFADWCRVANDRSVEIHRLMVQIEELKREVARLHDAAKIYEEKWSGVVVRLNEAEAEVARLKDDPTLSAHLSRELNPECSCAVCAVFREYLTEVNHQGEL